MHRAITPPPDNEDEPSKYLYQRHTHLTAMPCDSTGNDIPPGSPPPGKQRASPGPATSNPWYPFEDRSSFDFARFHFVQAQSSESQINQSLDIIQARLLRHGDCAPWPNARALYAAIDDIREENTTWQTYHITYAGKRPKFAPLWMRQRYTFSIRNSQQVIREQLKTEEFKNKFNYTPYCQFSPQGERIYSNLMSGTWAWDQADTIAADPERCEETRGAMLVPIVLGSDKTTVSVGTGHQEYHPGYISPGNLVNVARRTHGNGLLPFMFFPIPKTNQRDRKTVEFQQFSRQLYHACLSRALRPLKNGMTIPEVVECPDGHFRRAIYELGPYIADYPEQVWLSGIVQGWCPRCTAKPTKLDEDTTALPRSRGIREFMVQVFDPGTLWTEHGLRSDVIPFTHEFPRADIHKLLSADLLHQLIKGTFKDHLVEWINEYILLINGKAEGLKIIKDIDRRISAVPAYPGLRRFPDGRDFVQWTGDDSKALMKVYIAAIAGYVPPVIVQCLSSFMEVCYIARKNVITSSNLTSLRCYLRTFHETRKVFIECGVRKDISLPRQHSLLHYEESIRMFGAPNGLCSSITESKHIKAVKEPWRRSSRYNALNQMIRTILRLDKMAALTRKFKQQGMLNSTASSYTAALLRGESSATEIPHHDHFPDISNDGDLRPSEAPRDHTSIRLAIKRAPGYAKWAQDLALQIGEPQFPDQLRRFVHTLSHPHLSPSDSFSTNECPSFNGPLSVYHSAVISAYAPSDGCGTGGMYYEHIRSSPSFRQMHPRRDTVFVQINPDQAVIKGMVVARILMFFSFKYLAATQPCALVDWYVPSDDAPDPDTGMWVVEPEYVGRRRSVQVIPLDTIAHSAHLLPVYGDETLPETFHFSDSLDAFNFYYINKYANHFMYDFLQQ
ncbi:hypothetical protein PQX77_015008 [Marasmius sp. AFHP31]|nr:hypothetical protein PQX77_015008 [Marasmius sp. AFHP31]